MKRRPSSSSNSDVEWSGEPTDNENEPLTPVYSSWGDMLRHWPKPTLCIVSNEFCERFSFYGMRTVLTLYLLNVLKFSDSTATVFFNGFTVVCYLTPLFGSILADGFIGKFWTIFCLSIVYASGQVILAVGSTQNFQSNLHSWFDLMGLVIIAIGTGGIKPCVSSFGADQFEKHQERMLSIYFSVFYFSINAGSMISTFCTPIFRSQSCMGQDSCYPLAFGIPAALMVVATGIFTIGSCCYKRPPIKDNVFADFARTIGVAIKNKISYKQKRSHWLEHYLDSHDCSRDMKCLEMKKVKGDESFCQKAKFVADVKSLLRVIIMYLPVPMFWALYDQQGSVWTIQALQMDCRLGKVLLLPDQMQTLNAVLILAFIPLFQIIVYPLVEKCFKCTPLRKMVGGGLLASAAFIITGIVQLEVNKTLPDLPGNGKSFVSVSNVFFNNSCNINVAVNGMTRDVPSNTSLLDDASAKKDELFRLNAGLNKFDFLYSGDCASNTLLPSTATFDLSSEAIHNIAINEFGAFITEADPDKPTDGNGEFALMIRLAANQNYAEHLALCRVQTDPKKNNTEHPCNPRSAAEFYYWQTDYNDHTNDIDDVVNYKTGNNQDDDTHKVTVYTSKSIRPGWYKLYYMYNFTAKDVDRKTPKQEELNVTSTGVEIQVSGQGGVFMMILTGNLNETLNKHVFQVVPENRIHILWQVPQYVVLTAAEILFSITGYEFAYSQAAPSMKALVQALWLLTTAVGDLIIVAIALWDPFTNMAIAAFAYAAAMFVVICIFALLAIFYYTYNYYTGEESDNDVSQRTNKVAPALDQKDILENGAEKTKL